MTDLTKMMDIEVSHIESSADLKGPELVSGALTRQRQPKRPGRSSKVTGEKKNSKKSAAKKNEKKYECTVCGSCFMRSSGLIQHERVHTGERPYSCEWCSKSFSTVGHLKQHLRLHTKEKPFSCTYCDRHFTFDSSRIAHQRIHSAEKPFECPACNKGFKSSYKLNVHARTHTKERPYECYVCSKRFRQASHLQQYKCVVCGKGDRIRKHMKEFVQVENLILVNGVRRGFLSLCIWKCKLFTHITGCQECQGHDMGFTSVQYVSGTDLTIYWCRRCFKTFIWACFTRTAFEDANFA
ncbi:unnamed protein product [Cyprideis torosa]|uniref:Uncharacterized protein n=1 Tax=Cyprideis torosa TaxID=163714 RepID=A0A7R8WCD1_9CRUS|nr:unnamed protein product [Cyprideis torosa]CAG0893293.1 unnamed protein product [Cyprideis torosa]